MIFRRIKAHIKKENWLAVGIDFCIVVIGVFIGIQVANWNDARIEKLQSNDLYERLVAEAQEAQTALKRSLNSNQNCNFCIDIKSPVIWRSYEFETATAEVTCLLQLDP